MNGLLALRSLAQFLSCSRLVSRKGRNLEIPPPCPRLDSVLHAAQRNDQDELKSDIAHQTAMDTDQPLASSPTLCRFESSITREEAMRINDLLIDLFIESYRYPPELLILDFDATDDSVHGHQ